MSIKVPEKPKRSRKALLAFIKLYKDRGLSGPVLDIGSGEDEVFANIMRDNGIEVETVDFFENNDYVGDYNKIDFDRKFSGIWASHVLEHQPNPNSFLTKVRNDCYDGGLICITVPPLKNKIVGGHVTLWNLGLLYYQMILAGNDCSKESYHCTYGYNLSLITRNHDIEDSDFRSKLLYDEGDIETLSQYFPFNAKQNFDGQLKDKWI